ncbi:MAG: HNH endonuclease [Bacteroidota bacterium]
MAKVNDEYWAFTNALTDYNGRQFISCLEISINFIEMYSEEPYSEEKYSRLQLLIKDEYNINLISIRKLINQLVKMGFINPFLISYNIDSIEYINARSNKKRASLLSKIVYSNSSFNRAVNEDSNLHQLNFLIKTLVEHGKLSREEIIALMLVDIASKPNGYLDRAELDFNVALAIQNNFIQRKYNQVGYLLNLLAKLDDLLFVDDVLYFREDALNIFGEIIDNTRIIRDPYLHRLYKNQLKEESAITFGSPKCMLEKMEYPVLIASHIKPFIVSDESERYDSNNGILLSRNMDALFDLGYITFTDEGVIQCSERLKNEVTDFVSNYRLDNTLLTPRRIGYLHYHRTEVFNLNRHQEIPA